MDCCNYAQPTYFYPHPAAQQPPPPRPLHQQQQQQHQHQQPPPPQQQQQQLQHYCYEQPYAPYAPSARYNCASLAPGCYPTDYVYNPKEARLRKAMREQTREHQQHQHPHHQQHPQQQQHQQQQQQQQQQHRQQHQQQPQQQSPLPAGGGGNPSSGRMVSPWFSLGQTASGVPPPPPPPPPLPPSSVAGASTSAAATHPKPILSPRVMAAHQRTLDKTKDVIRKQLECVATNFSAVPSSSYPSDYSMAHAPQESGGSDYCSLSDFSDGQKWHPYQNGMSAYHSRSALMSKMNSLHRGMQSTASHAAATPVWGQFCNVPFPTSQNAMMRSNRHMVFLQEQQNQPSQQHCGYSTEMQQLSYEAKMQDDLSLRLHSSFPQEEQQVKSPVREEVKPCPDESASWRSNGSRSDASTERRESSSESSSSPPRPSSCAQQQQQPQQPTQQQQPKQHQQQQPTQNSSSSSSSSSSRQPLPGFQQAFGSTEIGKFSRSELFASLVEAASNVSSSASSSNSSLDEQSQQQQQQQRQSRLLQQSAFDGRSASPELLAGASAAYTGYGQSESGSRGGSAGSAMPRWHSPYVGAIGSEI